MPGFLFGKLIFFCYDWVIKNTMHVTFKRIDSTLPLPEYKTPGAVAFDLIARETTVIPERGIARVPSNFIVKIPVGYMLLIRDRSSTCQKKGLFCTAGVIDQDYCGDSDELQVQYYNFLDTPVTVERGERLAQAIFIKIEKAKWQESATMATNSRGGFGTTD